MIYIIIASPHRTHHPLGGHETKRPTTRLQLGRSTIEAAILVDNHPVAPARLRPEPEKRVVAAVLGEAELVGDRAERGRRDARALQRQRDEVEAAIGDPREARVGDERTLGKVEVLQPDTQKRDVTPSISDERATLSEYFPVSYGYG